MSYSEIFKEINSHTIQGLMFHSQMANYYNFLGLDKYKCKHERQYIDESKKMLKINEYYISTHNRLIPEDEQSNPNLIPKNWFNYSRLDVDSSTKMSAIRSGAQAWVDWETSTLDLLERSYAQLRNDGSIKDAIFIEKLMEDVSCELIEATKELIYLKSVDYDPIYVIETQQDSSKFS